MKETLRNVAFDILNAISNHGNFYEPATRTYATTGAEKARHATILKRKLIKSGFSEDNAGKLAHEELRHSLACSKGTRLGIIRNRKGQAYNAFCEIPEDLGITETWKISTADIERHFSFGDAICVIQGLINSLTKYKARY